MLSHSCAVDAAVSGYRIRDIDRFGSPGISFGWSDRHIIGRIAQRFCFCLVCGQLFIFKESGERGVKVRKRLIIVFIIGFLMMGIGGGIAFAEFSSFRYGGNIQLGGEMATVKLQQTVPEDAEEIIIWPYGYRLDRIQVVEDSSLAKDEITVEVTCNTDNIKPFMDEQEDSEEEAGTEVPKKSVFVLGYTGYDSSDGVSEFFQVKDEILESIKNRTIYTYSYDDVDRVVIKVSSDRAGRISIN